MAKLNRKGFILVETLVVTIFVVALFIIVYQNTVLSMGEYEQMSNYDDIDSLYATNLFKQNLIRYGNFDYINTTLASDKYVDISNCNDTNIYTNSSYCIKLKRNMEISDDDYLILTNYNINEFRNVVNNNDFFDSGKFSNFRSYIATVGDIDSYYKKNKQTYDTEYRLFIIRTAINSDNSSTIKYANLGVFFNDELEAIPEQLNGKILDDNNLITATPTLSSPTIDQSGLYISTDTNSGNSTYYFRGNVKNNYVVFSGYYWRIVRINEDGTIRLILANNIGKLSMGYEYYAISNVINVVDKWLYDNISNIGDKVVCGNTYYCESATGDQFDFKCYTDNNGHDYISECAGLITNSEVVFAGGYSGVSNSNYYLYNGDSILTMTPIITYDSNEEKNINFWSIYNDGSLQLVSYKNENLVIRPVINLSANSTATGKGTVTDPYIVE